MKKQLTSMAFTLIELLVVIAVILVLAGLLLPALSKSKESGRVVRCATNLRQLQLAALDYAATHADGELPHEASFWDPNRDRTWFTHVAGWVAFYNYTNGYGQATAPAANAGRYDWQNSANLGTASITNGALWSRIRVLTVYLCPTFAQRTVCNSPVPARSYSMTSVGGNRIYGVSGASVMFGDDNLVTNTRFDPQFNATTEVGRWHTFTNALAGGQVIFVDGHIEKRR